MNDQPANRYRDGAYWSEHSDLHEADSDFKFRNFQALLFRHPGLPITGIADIGCGAGRITWLFANAYPVPCAGVDLDPNIISYAAGKYQAPNLHYTTVIAAVEEAGQYNLAVLADVFEHVDDYTGLLKNIRQHFGYQLFNIPLDLSMRSLLRNGPLVARKRFGHLHYFYDNLALEILHDNGFEVIDFLYADNIGFDYRQKRSPGLLFKLAGARVLAALLGKSRVSRLLGCYSLTVLCRRSESRS